jgi:hypothetical protein
MGSWIATQAGATPAVDTQLLEKILGDLQLHNQPRGH